MKRRALILARRQSGFTLIEIAAVLILLGIVAVGAVSVLPDSDAALPTEADRLSSDLRYAQIRAQADVYQWRLRFIDADTYELGPVVVPGVGFTAAIVPGTGATSRTLTDGITTTDSTKVINFDSWGRPVGDLTITLTDGGKTRTITIQSGTGLIP